MKSHMRREMRLRDVIEAVSQYVRNDHEVGLVVSDLIHRGVVRLHNRHQPPAEPVTRIQLRNTIQEGRFGTFAFSSRMKLSRSCGVMMKLRKIPVFLRIRTTRR